MERKVVQKTSFLGGEAGPLLEGRSELAQYQLGTSPGQNFINLKGGGVTRRPGTRYVKNTQGDVPAKLFPFVINYDNGSDMYVLEIGLVDYSASTSDSPIYGGGKALTFRVIRISDNSVYTPTGNPAPKLTDCVYATAAALPTVVYANGAAGVGATLTASANGALSVDGAAPAVGNRILVKDQAAKLQNGVYTVTDAGSGGTKFVLTRATDFDTVAEVLPLSIFYVTSGSTNPLTYWQMISPVAPVMGTDGITFRSAPTISLDDIQVSQSAETLFISSKGFPPHVLVRATSSPTFTLSPYIAYSTTSRSEWFSVPYKDANTSATTLSIDVATVGTLRTVTASVGIFTDSSVIGSYYRMKTSGGSDGWFRITEWTSTTVVIVTVVSAISAAASATTDWSEGSWSHFRGFPRAITFYDQRLGFGGTTHQPDTFWLSQVDDYFQMSASTTGIDDPVVFTLASSKLNQIRWMVGGKKLSIGTSSSEWVGTVTNDGTNLFVQFNEETTHGSFQHQTHKTAYAIPFIQRSGSTIREMLFNFDSDSYEATDLNLFGSHVGLPSDPYDSLSQFDVYIKQLAFQESPFGVLWALDSVGRLYGLTRDKQQQIAAWHSHILGGSFNTSYPPQIQSICVIPSTDGRKDKLWLVVKRTINGSTKYHIEFIDDIKTHPNLKIGETGGIFGGPIGDLRSFVDCSSIQQGISSKNWSGYTRFASTDAYVVATDSDDAIVYCGLLSVSAGGAIVLPKSATHVVVGLHVNAYIRLLPIEGGDAPQINMNAEKGADSVAIRMHQTWGLRIGRNRVVRLSGNEVNTTFEPIPFDYTPVSPIETFTGIKIVPVPGDNGTDVSFALAMQEPWPCTILSLSTRVTNNEV